MMKTTNDDLYEYHCQCGSDKFVVEEVLDDGSAVLTCESCGEKVIAGPLYENLDDIN